MNNVRAVTTMKMMGRFSTGMEQLSPSAENAHVGSFSTGMEQLSPEATQVGRFSTGMEQLDPAPEKDQIGRFSTGMEQAGSENPWPRERLQPATPGSPSISEL